MKNLHLLFILLVLGYIGEGRVHAQHNTLFTGIRIGPALPMGEFASHNYGSGGYALLGKSIGGEAAWFVNENLGFGINVSYKTFEFASGFYAEDYVENEPTYLTMDLLSSPYRLQTYMGGVFYQIKILNRFYSTFKCMSGIYMARTPTQFYGVTDKLLKVENFFWKTSSSDIQLAFLTGASLEYKLYDHVSVLVQADFSYSEPAFVFIKGKDQYTNNLKMPVFQLLPGINIHF